METYIWKIDYANRRGECVFTAKGILKAKSKEEALDILWDNKGNQYAYNPKVELIDDDVNFIEIL